MNQSDTLIRVLMEIYKSKLRQNFELTLIDNTLYSRKKDFHF